MTWIALALRSTIDEDLTTDHKQIAKTTGKLHRARQYLPRVVDCGLYIMHWFIHILVMIYDNNAWGKTHTTRLQSLRRLHKKILRIIIFLKIFTDHTCPLFKELAVLPLDDVNNENNETITLFIFGLFNTMLPSSFNEYFRLNKDVYKYNTWPSSNKHKTQTHTNCQEHSVKSKENFIWNNLPKSMKEIKTFSLFKKTMKPIFSSKRKKKHQSLTVNRYN